jgi:selenocysteine lyase/cysteine desulfurase
MKAISAYESELAQHLIDGLGNVPGLQMYGITKPDRLHERGATVAFTMEGRRPRAIAETLAHQGIYCWSGNYYALRLMERLGLEPDGAVRIGLVHYNTFAEIEQLLAALHELANR